MAGIEFSAVLPCFNEEEHIEEAVARIETALQGVSHEIIIVDDGSTDRTRERALKLSDVTILSYAKNRGKGEAIILGMMQAKGKAVGHIDGDLDIEPEMLSMYLDALKDADIAIASKRHPDSIVDVPLQRKFLSWGFYKFIRVMLHVKASDTQTGMKIARKSAMDRILPLLAVKRYAFDVEVLTVAELLGLKVVELPVVLKLSRHFKGRDAAKMVIEILGIAYRLRIRHWYQKKIQMRVLSN